MAQKFADMTKPIKQELREAIAALVRAEQHPVGGHMGALVASAEDHAKRAINLLQRIKGAGDGTNRHTFANNGQSSRSGNDFPASDVQQGARMAHSPKA